MILIEDEAAVDVGAREALLDRVMGAERVLKPSERLREGRLPASGLALVARDGRNVVGSVRLWHVKGGGRPALLLGPLGVEQDLHGRGIGAGLMRVALNRAALAGHRAVILVGEAAYYERFGFSASAVHGLVMPQPVERHRFLGTELVPGALDGAAGMVVAAGALAERPLLAA